jgi:hypothetical protein
MKKMNETFLIRALLHEMNEDEITLFNEYASNNETVRQKIEDWRKVKVQFKQKDTDFSSSFASNVMESIRQNKIQKQRNQQIFRSLVRISFSMAAAALLLLLFVIWQENSLTVDGILGINNLGSDDFSSLLADY